MPKTTKPEPARKPSRGQGYTQAARDQCRSLYEANRELKAIEKAIGPTVSSITSWARKEGWIRNKISEEPYNTSKAVQGIPSGSSLSRDSMQGDSGINGERSAQRSETQSVHVDANERLIASHKELLTKLHGRINALLESSQTGKSSPAKYLLDLARAIRDVIGLERQTYGLDAHVTGPVPVILLPVKAVSVEAWQAATAEALGVEVSNLQKVEAIQPGSEQEN